MIIFIIVTFILFNQMNCRSYMCLKVILNYDLDSELNEESQLIVLSNIIDG